MSNTAMSNKKIISYMVKGFTELENTEIHRILADPRGWTGSGYEFSETTEKAYHVLIKKVPSHVMDEQFKSTPRLRGLSVTITYKGKKPSEIWINQQNWMNKPKDFVGSRKLYREYLIQHEMGHALGRGHSPTRGVQNNCPVMYQQTKGTRSICQSNPWITQE